MAPSAAAAAACTASWATHAQEQQQSQKQPQSQKTHRNWRFTQEQQHQDKGDPASMPEGFTCRQQQQQREQRRRFCGLCPQRQSLQRFAALCVVCVLCFCLSKGSISPAAAAATETSGDTSSPKTSERLRFISSHRVLSDYQISLQENAEEQKEVGNDPANSMIRTPVSPVQQRHALAETLQEIIKGEH